MKTMRILSQENGAFRTDGAVLIMVLWFLAIATLLVSTVAVEIRLSAKLVLNQKQTVAQWAEVQRAFHAAQMELMLQRMPPSPEELEIPLPERENRLNHFDGRPITPSYPVPDHITIRIYDHAGKINLQRLSVPQFRDLMKTFVGDTEPLKIDALLDAWQDWRDADDLKRINGAEKDYYETLSPPYEPRNGMPETVFELGLVKGFGEAFGDLDLEEVFTVYENRPNVNPNLATRKTLSLLPGMTEEALEMILAARAEGDLKNIQELKKFFTLPDQLRQLTPWLNFAHGTTYTITIEVHEPGKPKGDDEEPNKAPANKRKPYVYSAIVQLYRGYGAPPRVLMVNPYARLPEEVEVSGVMEEEKK